MVNGIEAYIYIYHMGLHFNLPVLPENITDTLSSSFQTTPILARSAPQITFSSAGPRTVQTNIKIHRHLFALVNSHIPTRTEKKSEEIIDPSTGLIKTITKTKTYMDYTDPTTGKLIEIQTKDAADLLIKALMTLSLPKYTDSLKAIVPPSILIRYGNETSIRGVPTGFSKTSSGVWLKSGKLSEVTIVFSITEVEPFSAQFIAQHGELRAIDSTLRRG